MDIRRHLPHRIGLRFDALGAFVEAVVKNEEDRLNIPKRERIKAPQKSEISLLVFVFSLRHLLEEGSRAAQAATEELAELGIPGFSVGQQTFEPGNENTMRGQRLAEELWECIDDPRVKNLLDSQNRLTECTLEIYNVYRNPQRLDRYTQAEN